MLPFLPLLRFATFDGRARRGEYWSFIALQVVAIVGCVVMAVLSLSQGPYGVMATAGWLLGAVLIMMICSVPNYAVLARRLHDTGRSVRWMALLLPGMLNQIMTFQAAGRSVSAALQTRSAPFEDAMRSAVVAESGPLAVMGVVAAACGLVLFAFTLMPGTRGPNRFGPDPKDPDAVASDAGGIGMGHGGWTDEDRLDVLFAQARQDAERAEARYGSALEAGSASAPYPPHWRAPQQGQHEPRRTFGRRGA